MTRVELEDEDDEQIEPCDRLLPVPGGTPCEIMRSIKGVCDTRVSHTCYVSSETATALPTMRDFFWSGNRRRFGYRGLWCD